MHTTQTGPTEKEAPPADPTPVQSVMEQRIRAPLAALRACLESLARSATSEASTAGVFDQALRMLGRLTRSVETLYEFSSVPPLAPLRCSVEEIARAAVSDLPDDLRGRIWLALEPNVLPVVVDGPILSRCLARLLERAFLRGSEEVLLHSHQDAASTTFAIVDDLASAALPGLDPDEPYDASGARETIEVALARREVERMHGRVSVHRTSSEHECVIVHVPNTPEQGSES